MKKILFCIHKNSPFYHVIPRALSDLGYAVSVFDYYQSDLKVRAVGVLNNFITFDPQRTFINQEINRSLISRVKSKKPDYLFIIKGLHIENETIEEIKKQNVITINWFQDLLEFMPWLKKHGKVYDYLFTPDPLMKRELKKNDITSYLLPLASQPDENINNEQKIYDVVFSGQYTKRREKLFKKLSTLNNKFIIWGFPQWKKSSLSKHYQGFIPTVDEMLNRFRKSKIIVNIQTAEDKYPSEVVSLRAFEATGVGSFLLNWRHKDIDTFWKDGREIVNFKDSDDLVSKTKYYLNNNKKREKIAYNGWLRTKKQHTWKRRFKKLFSIVK